jgi:hypothetical protein
MKIGAYRIHEFDGGWDFDKSKGGRAGPLNRAFLNSKMKGVVMNVCCGIDRTGHILIDVDPKMRPTVVADADHLPFRKKCVDTVICDPPFKKYSHFVWIHGLTDTARHRLILCAPTIVPHLHKRWHRIVYFIDTGTIFMRIWFVFTVDSLDVIPA